MLTVDYSVYLAMKKARHSIQSGSVRPLWAIGVEASKCSFWYEETLER